ncbi:hypothetical protein [Nostoc sp. FACHB-857]|uniref:hypothetical protein n=1 Tax=Nostoc sp. FACHB-857 TaxID=2692840 RepID=UPI001A7E87CB|nr:hypothetical protein [Nostoc sp. FACHB-857]
MYKWKQAIGNRVKSLLVLGFDDRTINLCPNLAGNCYTAGFLLESEFDLQEITSILQACCAAIALNIHSQRNCRIITAIGRLRDFQVKKYPIAIVHC